MSAAGPDFDRALEWVRRRLPTWPLHAEVAAYLERLLLEVRHEERRAIMRYLRAGITCGNLGGARDRIGDKTLAVLIDEIGAGAHVETSPGAGKDSEESENTKEVG